MHWQLQFTGMYNCTNAVIIAQVLIVCNALAIAMFRTKKTSSMASSIPAFGFLSQETMYVLCIIHNWIIAHGQSQRVTKKVTSTLTLQGVHCALGTIDLYALVRLLSNLRDTILILPLTYVGLLVTAAPSITIAAWSALCNCSAWVWRAWNSWNCNKLLSCFA